MSSPRLRGGQLVRWVSSRPHRRASTPGVAPFGESVPPDSSCSARVVRFPPRRLTPRAGFQDFAPGTGLTSLVSTALTRRPPRRLPDEMHGEGASRFPRSVAFTPLEEPASRVLAHPGREPWTRRAASPRPLPPCRFYDFEALLGSERPVRSVRPCEPTARTLSFHGLCSPSRSSLSPVPASLFRPYGRRVLRGSSHRLRGVCPVEELLTVAGQRSPWGFRRQRSLVVPPLAGLPVGRPFGRTGSGG